MNDQPAPKKQQANPQTKPISQPPPQEIPPQTPKTTKNKWLVPVVIVIVIILLGIAGFFAYQGFQPQTESSKTTNSTPALSEPKSSPASVSKVTILVSFTEKATKEEILSVVNQYDLEPEEDNIFRYAFAEIRSDRKDIETYIPKLTTLEFIDDCEVLFRKGDGGLDYSLCRVVFSHPANREEILEFLAISQGLPITVNLGATRFKTERGTAGTTAKNLKAEQAVKNAFVEVPSTTQ